MQERPFGDHSYNQFLNEEKLMGSKCKKCRALYTPPRSICIECHSSEMKWIPMSGEGILDAFTCIAIGPPFMASEGFDRDHPYCSGVVELNEGPRVDARIEGVDTNAPETIKIGTPLKVKFLHRRDGENLKTYLAFVPYDS